VVGVAAWRFRVEHEIRIRGELCLDDAYVEKNTRLCIMDFTVVNISVAILAFSFDR